MCFFADARRMPGLFERLKDKPIAEGFADGFGFGMDVELVVDAANVVAHGVEADV